jgi:hypothetical protein
VLSNGVGADYLEELYHGRHMNCSRLESQVRKLFSCSRCCADFADSNMARDSFATFIPLSVESDARTNIIFDFFDLLSAIAAHGKTNGLGGRKLSRLAGWWAFEHTDGGNGFDGGYKTWARYAVPTIVEVMC